MNKKYNIFKYGLELLVVALVPFAYWGYTLLFMESLLKNKKPESPFKTISKSMYYGFSYTIGLIMWIFTLAQIMLILLVFAATVDYAFDSVIATTLFAIATLLVGLIVLPIGIQIINLIYLKNKTINSFFNLKECWRLFKKDIKGWIGLYIKIVLFVLSVIAIITLPLIIFIVGPFMFMVVGIILLIAAIPLIVLLPPFITLKISEFAASQYKRTKYIK